MKKLAKMAPGTVEQSPPALKAPQSIVHIKHKISLQQYKYWVLLLQEFRQQLEGGVTPDADGFYSMPMKTLSELIGYTPNKSEVWNDLLALKNETIAFNVLNKDREKEKYGAGFISEWKVSNSFIRFKFPSFLENVMRGLDDPKEMFALINWGVFNHFTGKHEAIIYKLCKDYLSSPGRRTPDMTLQQFRDYMGLKEGEYTEFMRLGQRVITEPVKRINASDISDITVTPHLYREGRKVTGLYFSVESKSQSSLQFPDLEEESIFKFAKVPITPKLQQEYLAIRPQAHIALCIERANEYGEGLERAGKTATYGAIYRKAITEGWHEQQAIKNAKRAAVKEAKQAEDSDKQTVEEATKDTKKRDREDRAKAWAIFEAMTEAEQDALEADFLGQGLEAHNAGFAKQGRESMFFKIYLKNRLLK